MRRSLWILRRLLLPLAILAAAEFCFAQTPAPTIGTTGNMGHHEEGVSGPIVESPDAMKVTGTILCWCGGCQNQSIHDCTCGLAADERKKVAQALAAGRKPDDLIAGYVADHGAQILIVPEKRGLDLIGWSVPFAAALSALAALSVVLLSWKRRGVETAPAGIPRAMTAAERTYRDRLERDLKEVE